MRGEYHRVPDPPVAVATTAPEFPPLHFTCVGAKLSEIGAAAGTSTASVSAQRFTSLTTTVYIPEPILLRLEVVMP